MRRPASELATFSPMSVAASRNVQLISSSKQQQQAAAAAAL
jgi:hypothetical protein